MLKVAASPGSWSAQGKESIACAVGIHGKAQSKQGWIVIVDWRQNKTRDWFIKQIYSAKVGGRIKGRKIRKGTWYWFEDGKLRSEARS